eukprot:TRINITY_DN1201_c0_g1_i2.p1 TRINITY_DN1201_c0_g1~~TRINITY_DN1201_c0_g1_i2.p1  ORF type:complete len:224 (+),score=31.84 TRINITY_DN1201_c0_g1_i2:144-815(+)
MDRRHERALARSAETSRGADAFVLPAAVTEYFASLDAEGRAIAARARWWQDFLREYCSDGCDWVRNWPSHSRHLETNDHIHRITEPMNYVSGRASPMYIERAYRKDRKRAVWAVYFGPYSCFTGNQAGGAHGGAVSAVLDTITANVATLFLQGRCMTASLSVRFRKMAPAPALLKAEAWVDGEVDEAGRILVNAELGDGDGGIFDTCEAVLVSKSNLKPRGKL